MVRNIFFILSTILTPYLLFGSFFFPSVKHLHLSNPAQCRTTGRCSFNFTIVDENGSWNCSNISGISEQKEKKGSCPYNITIETEDSLFTGSLLECMHSGPCRIDHRGFYFSKIYENPGTHLVRIILRESDSGKKSDAFIRHSTLIHRPICLYEGTNREGWYWEDQFIFNSQHAFIKTAKCGNSLEPQCRNIGSSYEGWYTTDDSISHSQIISDQQCHKTLNLSLEGEECEEGIASCHGENLECSAGTCIAKNRLCLVYELEEGSSKRYKASNHTNYSDAISDLEMNHDENNSPLFNNEAILPGTCRNQLRKCHHTYTPVCGSINGNRRTYKNTCKFKVAVRTAAELEGSAEGTWKKGECE